MISMIKTEQLKARKEKNKFKTNILTALLSEIITIGKNNGNRETTNEEAKEVIRKFKKNVNENLKITADTEKIDLFLKEISIYDSFLPKQMKQRETEVAVEDIISTLEKPNIGNIMKELKNQYGELLDMVLTSKIVKEKMKFT